MSQPQKNTNDPREQQDQLNQGTTGTRSDRAKGTQGQRENQPARRDEYRPENDPLQPSPDETKEEKMRRERMAKGAEGKMDDCGC